MHEQIEQLQEVVVGLIGRLRQPLTDAVGEQYLLASLSCCGVPRRRPGSWTTSPTWAP
ncbi:MAG: hypothetical protein WCG47_16250 [Dermatophilaceae bacterium]